MPNGWIKKAYVQGFDSKTLTFKQVVDMFECVKIAETTYEGVVKYSTIADANRVGDRSQKRGESASQVFYSKMGKRAGKSKQGRVNHPREGYNINYLIHGLGS